jgi:leucyl-tRNA synthetase
MSKSTGNLVGAIDMAEKYGCDTARMYTLFAAPPEKDLEWNEQGIEGCARFLQRVFRLVDRHAATVRGLAPAGAASSAKDDSAFGQLSKAEKELLRKAHQVLQRVTSDFEARWHFNTSVALIMEYVNALYAQEPLNENVRPEVLRELMNLLTVMLTPMVPHLAAELWETLGHADALDRRAWPEYSAALASDEQVEIVIQVNGRVRGKILVSVGLSNEKLLDVARNDSKIKPLLAGGVTKSIVVPNKLVNFIVPAPKE